MKRAVLTAGIAALLIAACSKPTELASEANAKYDRRDPVVAAPPPDAIVDTTPVAPVPGSPEAEALAPVELQPGTAETVQESPAQPADPTLPPTESEGVAAPTVETAPATEPTVPPPTETPAPTEAPPPG